MNIIGIDPGLAKLGWGVIDAYDKNKIKLIDYGCISTSGSDSIGERLEKIYGGIQAVVRRFRPREAAVEKLFFAKNSRTAMEVAQARGVLLLALSRRKISISEYTPLQIKQALVGYGKADKKQVQYMVKQFLELRKIPEPDHSADALAAALCHSNSRIIESIEMMR